MKLTALCGAAALLAMSAAPAFANELLDKCKAIVASEGQAEGEAGCDCMVSEIGDDTALYEEFLAQADVPAEEREHSDAGIAIVENCFPSQ